MPDTRRGSARSGSLSAATSAFTNEGTSSQRRAWRSLTRHNAPAVEDWIYEYGLLDEFAVNAYWTGKYAECVDACDRLLNEGKLPTEKRDRVLKNKQFAIEKLAEINAPRSITLKSAWVPEAPAAGTELMVAGPKRANRQRA